MQKLVNNWLLGELIQSCIILDDMWYLPLDQLADLILILIIFAAFFLAVLERVVDVIITLIIHHNKKK